MSDREHEIHPNNPLRDTRRRRFERDGEPLRLTNKYDTGKRDPLDGDPVVETETVYTRGQVREPNSPRTSRTAAGENVEADATIRVHIDLLPDESAVRDRTDEDAAIDETTIARLASDPFDADGNRRTDADGNEIPDDVLDTYNALRSTREGRTGTLLVQSELA